MTGALDQKQQNTTIQKLGYQLLTQRMGEMMIVMKRSCH
jgi:hypothetical protein